MLKRVIFLLTVLVNTFLCTETDPRTVIEGVISVLSDSNVTVVDQPTVEHLIALCDYAKTNDKIIADDGEVVFEELGIFSPLLIYPGTKWCGAGNISKDYDDLGPEIECDKCCREHDHCNDSIPALQSKHGLHNKALYTKSHCDCDWKFYQCLQQADTKVSIRVGKIFFNYLRMKCFKEDFPIKDCKKKVGKIRPRCQEYEFDTTKDPIWQWFDSKEFKASKDNQTEGSVKGDVFEYMLVMLEKNGTCNFSSGNTETFI